MFDIKIKIPTLSTVQFTSQDMRRIGASALQSIRQRLAYGVGINDRRMKRLSPAYKARKQKIGQNPIRNLMYSGAMLGAMSIVTAESNRVVIGFTRRSEAIKASANHNRDPWFGLSRKDESIVQAFADKLLRSKSKTP